MEIWKNYEGKRVYIELKNRRKYSGYVKEICQDFLILIDKFGNLVTIDYMVLSTIEEQPKQDGRIQNGINRSDK